jgi:hypothetical protein
MRIEFDRDPGPDAILGAGEGDNAFDAWTLEELGEELGSLGTAFAESDDAGA